ncbi:MAG: T9SS type A sorting domain-containing protein [Ignavibacteriaceae bacterium]|jgi:photosystem II stability/assembly factor-like uncharacterized protein|nr:T9SS type A sorting domain-containing protein [Ignavibacteriaceae bacterium]
MKRFLLNLILIFFCFYHISAIAQWTQFAPGTYPFSYTWVEAIATTGTGIFVGTHSNGIFLSTDNGTTWVAAKTGLPSGSFVYTLAIMGNDVLAGTSNNWGIYKTTNSGAQWTQSGLTGIPIDCLAQIGTNLFAGSTLFGVYLSTDAGANWTAVKSDNGIYALTAGGTTLFAARNASIRGVYVSPDNGTNWTFPANTGFPTSNITALSTIGSNLFVETMTGVYLSIDDGANWTAVNNGLTTLNVRSAVVNGSNLFVGTNGGGVYLTTDNGSNWSAVNTGLTNKFVYSLAVIGSDLYAGTLGSGLWKRSLSDMITAVEDNKINQPSNFSLYQNYPNPFNPTTNIRFEIASPGFVSLKVIDLLGREVTSLVNEYKQAGNYDVNFDASKLSSGIYFYKLQAGNFSSTKKMVLTR